MGLESAQMVMASGPRASSASRPFGVDKSTVTTLENCTTAELKVLEQSSVVGLYGYADRGTMPFLAAHCIAYMGRSPPSVENQRRRMRVQRCMGHRWVLVAKHSVSALPSIAHTQLLRCHSPQPLKSKKQSTNGLGLSWTGDFCVAMATAAEMAAAELKA